MKILGDVLESRGGNPFVRLNRVVPPRHGDVFVQLEYLNPSGSIKDRIAAFMIEEAEKRGELRPGSRIVAATSGNTGIALALAGAVKGYEVTIVMPEQASEERRKVLSALGADIVLIPGGATCLEKCLAKVRELTESDSRVWVPGQFTSEDNIRAHMETTGPETVKAVGEDLGAYVAGIGTGGTLMGVARYLKKRGINAQIVAVEPEESAVFSGGCKGEHCIEGIGDGIIPDIVSRDSITRVEKIPEREALQMAKMLMKREGIMGGISAGANVAAAIRVAGDLGEGSKVATIIPDTCMRYFSTQLFNGF